MDATWEFTAIVFLPLLAIGLLYVNKTDSFEWKSAVSAFLRSRKIPEDHDDTVRALVRNKMLFASIDPTIMGCILACFQLSFKFTSSEYVFFACLLILMAYYIAAKRYASEVAWDDASDQRLPSDVLDRRWKPKDMPVKPRYSKRTRDEIVTLLLAASYMVVVILATAVMIKGWWASPSSLSVRQALGCVERPVSATPLTLTSRQRPSGVRTDDAARQ
jgi:1,4-dihydroxy-2-naphthoate octaprenyltransferase